MSFLFFSFSRAKGLTSDGGSTRRGLWLGFRQPVRRLLSRLSWTGPRGYSELQTGVVGWGKIRSWKPNLGLGFIIRKGSDQLLQLMYLNWQKPCRRCQLPIRLESCNRVRSLECQVHGGSWHVQYLLCIFGHYWSFLQLSRIHRVCSSWLKPIVVVLHVLLCAESTLVILYPPWSLTSATGLVMMMREVGMKLRDHLYLKY